MNENKKYGYWLHSGLYSFLQRLSVMFFGICSFSVLARTLTTDHVGVWALFLALTANIELIRWAIVKNAFVKYLSVHYKEANDEITTAALVLNILITGLFALMIVLFMPFLSHFLKAPELTRVMYIFILGLLLLIPFSHFEWIQNSQGDFRGIFVAYMVRQGSWFLMMVLHLLIHGSITLGWLAFYYSLGILAGGIVAFLYARKYLSRRIVFVRSWFLKLWRFGRVILGSAFSTMVFKNADQFLVSNMISLTAVAMYNTSLRIINLLDMPSQTLGDIMFPKSAQVSASNNKERLKEMYEKSVGGVLSLTIPASIVIFIFPKLILVVLAGKKFLEAAFIVRLMLINGIFSAFIKQFATIMDSSGKAPLNFSVITGMALLSVVSCYLFIGWLGLPGAVTGIIVTHLIGFGFSQYYLYKHYNVKFWNAFGYAVKFYPEMYKIFKERIILKWQANF
jgi:lipopolysaccharide exporter